MKDTLIFITIFIFCFSLLSCKTSKSSESVNIEGKVKILGDNLDKNLNSGGIVRGYVYSNLDKKYLEGAIIEVDKTKYYTDSKGFFFAKVNSGIHKISVFYIGHTSIILSEIKVEEKHNLDIRFELGSQVIICK